MSASTIKTGLLIALAAVALGLMADRSPGQIVHVIGGVVAVIAASRLAFGRAAYCAAAVVALATFGWMPTLVSFGSFDVRTVDAVTAVLIIRALARRPVLHEALGFHRLAVFLGVIGVTVLLLGMRADYGFASSGVSWVRLVTTASLAWLIPAVVTTRRELRLVLLTFACAGAAAVVYAGVTLGGAGRAAGLLGPNSLGMVSGILVLMSRYSPVPSHHLARLGVGGTGLAGLVLSRSIGSLAATGAAFIVAGVIIGWTRRSADAVGLTLVSRVIVAGILLVGTVAVLRPGDMPGSEGFGKSSTAIRVSVAYAGLRMWANEPLTGVGWQQSGRDDVLKDPQLVADVRKQFPGVRSYADVRGEGAEITSLHNVYVQVLAEAGVAGLVALLWLVAGMFKGVRTVLRRLQDRWLADVGGFLALALVFILVWWNDNALYGGQVETIMIFVFLGLVGAIAQLQHVPTSAESEPMPALEPAAVGTT